MAKTTASRLGSASNYSAGLVAFYVKPGRPGSKVRLAYNAGGSTAYGKVGWSVETGKPQRGRFSAAFRPNLAPRSL